MKGLLDGDILLNNVWVKGEISNFRHHAPSGHLYFTLKDASAQIRAVMFRSDALRAGRRHGDGESQSWRPKDGDKVLAGGNVSLYPRDGQYQLYVREMEPLGLGSLFLEFERLKKRLSAEGLFDPATKRGLPLLPRCVGVVTSSEGAALRDIITVARRRFPGIRLLLAPATVQGPGASAEITRALDLLGRTKEVQVIILARGGGSIEELWAFNDENLARAIRGSRCPVVTGIGHETDTTIADLAADRRAATPSNAAELVVPSRAELEGVVMALSGRLRRALGGGIERRRRQLAVIRAAAPLAKPTRLLQIPRQRIDGLGAALRLAARRVLQERVYRRGSLAARLDALSPLAVLGRGYSLCRREPDGAIVSRTALVEPGMEVSVRVSDGALGCRVHTVKPAGLGPEGGE